MYHGLCQLPLWQLSAPCCEALPQSCHDELGRPSPTAWIEALHNCHRKPPDLLHACLRTSDAQRHTNMDEHNLYRIRTMSESALRRRIYTIQRCDKLQSYVQVSALRPCISYLFSTPRLLSWSQPHTVSAAHATKLKGVRPSCHCCPEVAWRSWRRRLSSE